MKRLILPVLLATALSAAAEEPIELRCQGLEAYEITGTFDVDWVYGNIRSRSDRTVIGFASGLMIHTMVNRDRSPDFRWVKHETAGQVRLDYGLNQKENQIQATLIGAPIGRTLNLIARPKDQAVLLTLARLLAVAPCRRIRR